MGINPSNAQVAQILQQLKSGQEDESLNLIPVERFEEVGSCQQTCMPWQAWSMMWCSHQPAGAARGPPSGDPARLKRAKRSQMTLGFFLCTCC